MHTTLTRSTARSSTNASTRKAARSPKNLSRAKEIHARSVTLSSVRLGITAKLDLVEGEGSLVTPVDYKRGNRPHVPAGAYDPERVQLCAQGLLLREHGFECDSGVIYFAASRVRVPFDDDLVDKTISAISSLRGIAQSAHIPPPLEDCPKYPRCSLVGICLPDEVRFLNRSSPEPRPLFPALEGHACRGLIEVLRCSRVGVCEYGFSTARVRRLFVVFRSMGATVALVVPCSTPKGGLVVV